MRSKTTVPRTSLSVYVVIALGGNKGAEGKEAVTPLQSVCVCVPRLLTVTQAPSLSTPRLPCSQSKY